MDGAGRICRKALRRLTQTDEALGTFDHKAGKTVTQKALDQAFELTGYIENLARPGCASFRGRVGAQALGQRHGVLGLHDRLSSRACTCLSACQGTLGLGGFCLSSSKGVLGLLERDGRGLLLATRTLDCRPARVELLCSLGKLRGKLSDGLVELIGARGKDSVLDLGVLHGVLRLGKRHGAHVAVALCGTVV